MDSLAILVKAILSLKDVTDSKKQIASELPKLESQLQSDKNTRVKIIAGLDITKSKKVIQSQIDTLSSQLSGNTIKVGLEVTKNNGIQTVVGGLKQIQTQAQKTNNTVQHINNISNKGFISDKQIQATFNSLEKAEEYFKNFNVGEVTSVFNKGELQNIKDFTIRVKSATGEIEHFKYVVFNDGDDQNPIWKYQLQNINASNEGIQRLFKSTEKARSKYSRLLADFKSTNSAIESGLAKPIEDFKKVLNELGSTSSVDDVENAFQSLKQSASEITRYLDTANNSFNKATNAVNNYKNMDNVLNEMSTTFDNLTIKPEGLRSELDNVKVKLKELQDLESGIINGEKVKGAGGYTAEWAKQYQELNLELKKVKTNIELAAKAESNSQKADKNSAYQTQLKYLNKIKEETSYIVSLKKKLSTAGENESALYRREIDNAQKRVRNAKKQLSDKKLLTSEAKAVIKVYDDEIEYQNKINKAKQEDLKIAKRLTEQKEAQKKAQREASDKEKADNRTAKKHMSDLTSAYKELISLKNKYAGATNEDTKSAYLSEINATEKIIDNLEEEFKASGLLKQGYQEQIDVLKEKVTLTDRINNNKQADNTLKQQKQILQDYATDVQKTTKQIENAISSLDGLYNKNTFTKNKNNPQVSQVKAEIDSIRTEYQKLYAELQANPTSQGLETVKTKLAELDKRFKTATASADAFEKELKSETGSKALKQRIQLLTQQIKAFQTANTKASKIYSDEFAELFAGLDNPNIDERSFNQLYKKFQILRQEIKATGNAGKTMFQSIGDSIKKFSSWMSMTYAISQFASALRDSINELKEVDTLLTEISKANDKLTDSMLKQIGNNAFDIASKYGKQAADYLSGVQEMARAGYENVEAMGELSTAAQGAGDMTADTANAFIVAADKAYHMNGSVEKLTETLDGINYITNHNAVNMSELSEGFSIVASTAASFGIQADQLTAALGTMSATTQQSGSEVARAFRAILLNIRQVSDEEEGIDAEGLTKYEAACNALGVSLKETKDGVLQTRDAMEVLKELSVEYSKLSEDDLRRTNLLNSVGGKLRSTQLDALLRNWDTYESMLQQYADGSGSMAREANKICLVA